MSEEHKNKSCRYCGKTLPEEAIFCYYCHRELLTRPERPSQDPQPRPLNMVVVAVVVVIVVVVVVVVVLLFS